MGRLRGKLGLLALQAAQFAHNRQYVPADGQSISVDYPTSSRNEPRYGWGRPAHRRLSRLLENQEREFVQVLDRLASYTDELARIPVEDPGDGSLFWMNGFSSGLDGVAIYGFLRMYHPRRYIEVGSGYSTMFAERAKRDGGLDTTITSIDPNPRATIDRLCDRVIRQPFETIDLTEFAALEPGDIVFMDGSHRVFMNSDSVAFFLDVLPELPSAVVVGIDDILLPYDYFAGWADRYYSEQYLLAAYLLAPSAWIDPLLPCCYATYRESLRTHLDRLWQLPNMRGVNPLGTSWWFTISR